MTLTSTSAPGVDIMVNNQHRDQDRRADRLFLEEAIAHLRHQIQHAIPAGWTEETTEDGRRLIAGGSDAFREVLAETHGDWAEPVQAYLVTVQPRNMLSLLALLEALGRDVSLGEASRAVRTAAIELAEKILCRKRSAFVGRPSSTSST